MKLLLGAAVLAAGMLAASASGSSHENGVMLDGAIRCTAALTTPVSVPVGHELGIVFKLRNVTKHWRKIEATTDPRMGGLTLWIVVAGPHGTTYDSRSPFSGSFASFETPPPRPTRIWAGATVTEHLRLPARWEGPLRISAACGTAKLPTIPVRVTSPGLPTSRARAISEVVAASGHFLDHCRPRAPGVAVIGRIVAPGGEAPPLRARCSVSLRRERGFYLAQVLVVTPPVLDRVRVDFQRQPFNFVSLRSARIYSNDEVIAWEFVVTQRGAKSVDWAASTKTLDGGGTMPGGFWTSAGWSRPPGGNDCGGTSWGWSSIAKTWSGGPYVSFVSVCRR
jgi:hypothetical protein